MSNVYVFDLIFSWWGLVIQSTQSLKQESKNYTLHTHLSKQSGNGLKNTPKHLIPEEQDRNSQCKSLKTPGQSVGNFREGGRKESWVGKLGMSWENLQEASQKPGPVTHSFCQKASCLLHNSHLRKGLIPQAGLQFAVCYS